MAEQKEPMQRQVRCAVRMYSDGTRGLCFGPESLMGFALVRRAPRERCNSRVYDDDGGDEFEVGRDTELA